VLDVVSRLGATNSSRAPGLDHPLAGQAPEDIADHDAPWVELLEERTQLEVRDGELPVPPGLLKVLGRHEDKELLIAEGEAEFVGRASH